MWTLRVFLVLLVVCLAVSVDLKYSEITVVNDTTRWRINHPDAELVVFNKQHHVKGSFAFTSGNRITGDRLLLNFADETQFTKSEDVEVLLRYPVSGESDNILTKVEIYAGLTSADADTFFIDGGINKSHCSILLVGNTTLNYNYEIFIYGY